VVEADGVDDEKQVDVNFEVVGVDEVDDYYYCCYY